jgi:hypothetical protein
MLNVKKKGSLDFAKVIENLANFRENIISDLSNIAIEHFDEGFNKGGRQTDKSAGGWKRLANGRQSYLQRTGNLRRSIASRKGKRSFTIYVTNKANYGWYVNKDREFIGPSKVLTRKSLAYIKKQLKNVFR